MGISGEEAGKKTDENHKEEEKVVMMNDLWDPCQPYLSNLFII